MQAQRDVGVLGGVVSRALHVDLGERNRRALAGDVFVADRRRRDSEASASMSWRLVEEFNTYDSSIES
jgi:hypothetical protein